MEVEPATKENQSGLFSELEGQPGNACGISMILSVLQKPVRLEHKGGADTHCEDGAGKPGGGHCACKRIMLKNRDRIK